MARRPLLPVQNPDVEFGLAVQLPARQLRRAIRAVQLPAANASVQSIDCIKRRLTVLHSNFQIVQIGAENRISCRKPGGEC